MGVIFPQGTINGLTKGAAPITPKGNSSQVEKEVLIGLIHASTAAKLERIQAISDGAILAVEQVQDKRIDILEKGPEVSMQDILFDLLLGISLKGVAKALVPVAQSIANELVGTSIFYGKRSAKWAAAVKFCAPLINDKLASELADQKATPWTIRKFNENTRDLLVEGLGEKLQKVGEAAAESAIGKKSAMTNQVDLSSSDTPGVAILGAAQSYVSSQRYAISLYHAGFEAIVRSDLATNEELKQIREASTVESLSTEVSVIRDKMKLLFEAVIWARLYEWHSGKLNVKDGKLDFPGVTEALKKYFVKRFSRVAMDWVSGRASGRENRLTSSKLDNELDLEYYGDVSPSDDNPVYKDFTAKKADDVDPEKMIALLHRFFLSLMKDMEEVHKEQKTTEKNDGITIRQKPKAKETSED